MSHQEPEPPPSAPRAPRPVPAPEQLAALDVAGFLRRLDHSLGAIQTDSSLAALLPPEELRRIAGDERLAEIDALLRSALRGLLVATSFGDLPEEARVHPGVQRRVWGSMGEMDASVRGVGAALAALSEEERDDIGEALREEPELALRVLDVLEAEAVRAGVSEERRAHLRKIGEHAAFRLRVSVSGFIDEYTGKLRKARDLSAAESERYLVAAMGREAFEEQRSFQLAVMDEWQKILAAQGALLQSAGDEADSSGGGISADDAYAPPAGGAGAAGPPSRFDPNSGKTILKVGAWMFGLAMFSGMTGGVLVNVGHRLDGVVVVGLISFTAAAVLGVGGLICLLIGAILRLRAQSRAREALAYELNSRG